MVLNEVVCQGNEQSLSDCNVYKNLNGVAICDNSEYAGVRCESKYQFNLCDTSLKCCMW